LAQAPIRLFYVAGIVAASLVIFTGTLSYGIGARGHRDEPVLQQAEAARSGGHAPAASPPAAPATATQAVPVKPPAEKGTGTEAPAPGNAQPAAKAAPRVTQYTVAQGDTLWELAARYGVDLEDLLAANRGIDAGEIQVGQQLVIPAKTGTAVAASASAPEAESVAAYAGMFSWPVVAAVSSPFGPRWGRMHSGVDLAANMGDSIKAARDGEVLIVGEVPGYGNTVVLRHQDGTRTLYAHASKLLVKGGQKVRRGDVIALVGSTGHSTGPHLHFEIIVNNRPRDPLQLLPHH
jgi:murein DD-endopeptidase MepM/ murein hydrolase activator NlpD